MKILITGATGFIGQHLIKRLLLRGDSLYALIRNTTDLALLPNEVKQLLLPETQSALEEIFQKEKFDGVIHLASLYLMSHQQNDIKGLIDSNIKLGTRVIDAAAKTNTGFFINTGSFFQHYQGNTYNPTNLYAATKQAFQDIAQYYIEVTKLKVLTLELYNTFGPGDTRPKIFNLWNNAISEGKALDMSPGEQIIDISYIDNIIDAYVIAIDHLTGKKAADFSGKTYTLLSPERMTLKELSKVFAEEIGGDLKINFGSLPYRDRENMIPMDKVEALPGWSPKISLREGLRRTFKQ